jgi:hypothetical protein
MDFISGRQTTARFSTTVPPDTTRTLTKTIERDATAEQLMIRFYQGPELALEVKPTRERQAESLPLIDLYGREVVVGDNDVFNFSVAEPLEEGDELAVEVTNTDSEYSYDVSVDIVIDYAGGTARALSSIMETLL